jgi:hypothetical protein
MRSGEMTRYRAAACVLPSQVQNKKWSDKGEDKGQC